MDIRTWNFNWKKLGGRFTPTQTAGSSTTYELLRQCRITLSFIPQIIIESKECGVPINLFLVDLGKLKWGDKMESIEYNTLVLCISWAQAASPCWVVTGSRHVSWYRTRDVTGDCIALTWKIDVIVSLWQTRSSQTAGGAVGNNTEEILVFVGMAKARMYLLSSHVNKCAAAFWPKYMGGWIEWGSDRLTG